MRALLLAILLTSLAAGGRAADAGQGSPPPKPFGSVTEEHSGAPVDVSLSDGRTLAGAGVQARPDLVLLVFPKDAKRRVEISFADVRELEQVTIEEGLEQEWRWKEGGSDEKVFTGRSYPWRKHGIVLTLADGRMIEGALTRGFPLRISWSTPVGASAGAAQSEQPEAVPSVAPVANPESVDQPLADAGGHVRHSETFLITPRTKGEMGQTLDDLVYVRRIRLLSPQVPAQ